MFTIVAHFLYPVKSYLIFASLQSRLCARLDNVTPLCYSGFQQGEEIMVIANHIGYIVLDEQDDDFFYLADSLAEVEEQVRWLRATDQEPLVYEVGSPVTI